MQAQVGLIGGTGVGSLLAGLPGRSVFVPTEYGVVRGRLVDMASRSVFVLSRHSAGHSVPPHLVNYRGMATALKSLGVSHCFATAAVGSLKPDLEIGAFLVCSDFVDFTNRNLTLYDRGVVHTPFPVAFGASSRAALLEGAKSANASVKDGGVYIGLNGPRFETPQEIQLLAQFGDVVGMTAASEAIVMKEAGVEYGLLAIVTNMGEGIGGAVEHELVGKEMKQKGPEALAIIEKAIGVLS